MAITENTDKHPDTVVLWTNWITPNGKGIMVSIEIDKQGHVLPENSVATTFQPEEKYADQFFENEAKILYTKNNKSLTELLEHRRHMPVSELDDTLVKKSITLEYEKGNIRKSRRSGESMTNLLDIAEANARDERIRNEYMEAASNWRNNMTAISDFGKSGFNTNMTG